MTQRIEQKGKEQENRTEKRKDIRKIGRKVH